MNKKVQIVTSGFIKSDEKFLIVKRSADETFLPNVWELPGGKSEPEENPNDSVVREVYEECGLTITVTRPAVIKSYVSEERNIHYVEIFYLCSLVTESSQVILSEEHSEFKWISFEEIESYKSEMTPYIVETINILQDQ